MLTVMSQTNFLAPLHDRFRSLRENSLQIGRMNLPPCITFGVLNSFMLRSGTINARPNLLTEPSSAKSPSHTIRNNLLRDLFHPMYSLTRSIIEHPIFFSLRGVLDFIQP